MMKNIGNALGLYPTPDTVVGTVIDGRVNWMNVAHVGIWGMDRLLLSIGKPHFSCRGILENKTASVNLVDEALLERADYVGLVTGLGTDKSDVFEYFSGSLKNAPLIKDAPVAMECELTELHETPTHYNFIMRPVGTFVREDALTADGKIDFEKIRPILFEMQQRRYLRTGDVAGNCWNLGRNYKK
jgi:flavin reductase (DIM6/NTAB) family NADH-FMN oxidoreductase RutF